MAGLASRLGHMKTPVTLWEMVTGGNPYDDGWSPKLLYGQFIEKTRKTLDKTGSEVTSYASFLISERLDIKEKQYKIELGHTESLVPSANAYEPISFEGSPTLSETKAGKTASEWVIYV